MNGYQRIINTRISRKKNLPNTTLKASAPSVNNASAPKMPSVTPANAKQAKRRFIIVVAISGTLWIAIVILTGPPFDIAYS